MNRRTFLKAAAGGAALAVAAPNEALAANTCQSQLNAANATIAQLKSHGITPTFGAAVGPPSGVLGDDLANFKAVDQAHPNFGLRVRRYYKPPSAYDATYTELLPGYETLPFYSQKPPLDQAASGALDSVFTSFAKSCPPGAFLTIQHEMDNPSKGITPAQFIAGFNHWASVTKTANPLVKVGPVYMEYQMRVQGSNYGYTGIDPSLIDFWGFDAYVSNIPSQGYLTTDSAQTLCNYVAIPKMKAIRDLPFVVAEIGVPNNFGVNRTAWLNTARRWAKTANTTLLYYNAGQWMLTDAELSGLN